jgi:hypothetical protein
MAADNLFAHFNADQPSFVFLVTGDFYKVCLHDPKIVDQTSQEQGSAAGDVWLDTSSLDYLDRLCGKIRRLEKKTNGPLLQT